MLTIESVDQVLKSYYLDAICTQLNSGISPFYSAIEKTAALISGKDAIVPVELGISGGLGTNEEAGELPVSAAALRECLTVPLRNIYGVIDVSDKLLRANRDNASGLVSVLNTEIQMMIRSAQFNLNRMMWGNGDGLLGVIAERTEQTANPHEFKVEDARKLTAGMCIDIMRDNTPVYSNVRITDVDYINDIFTIEVISVAGHEDAAAGDKIYMQKSKGHEVNGVPYLFYNLSSDYYGLPKLYAPGIEPCVKDLNAELSLEAMQEFFDGISMRSAIPTNMIVCSLKTRRQYLNQLMLTRTNIDYLNLDGGFKTLAFNGVPVCGERFVEDGSMYYLNTDAFKLVQLCDWEWLQGDNGSILNQIDRKAVYTATLVKYANLVSTYPRAQGVMQGITDPA